MNTTKSQNDIFFNFHFSQIWFIWYGTITYASLPSIHQVTAFEWNKFGFSLQHWHWYVCLITEENYWMGWGDDELRWVLCFGFVTKCNVQGKFIDKWGKVRVRGFEQLLQLCVRRCVHKTHTRTHTHTHTKARTQKVRKKERASYDATERKIENKSEI